MSKIKYLKKLTLKYLKWEQQQQKEKAERKKKQRRT